MAENGVLMNGSASKSGSQPTRPANRARKASKGASAWLLSTTTRSEMHHCPLYKAH